MRYCAPDDQTVLVNPTPDQLEEILLTSPHSYWQQGGNGEASLDAGPGKASLWIKQPEPNRYFLTFVEASADWLVPYNGESCESLVEDERGGNPFWIPRACLIETDQAVDVVTRFVTHEEPSPAVRWCYWHELPLTESYPEP